MTGNKCPFSVVQAADLCACQHAQQVVRRGGAEYDCRNSDALSRCIALAEHLKVIALPALGYEDDLTQTPLSVYERIQVGGLIGLQGAASDGEHLIADIWPIIEATGSTEDIAADRFVPAIEGFKLKRRRRH